MKLRIDQIEVGERRREDMGDVQGLADSIAKYGLLHPIVVDDKNRLVAGGRRLEACRLLGWEEIEAWSLGELSERQLREIELEENLRRKDLTEKEYTKNFIELAEIKAEQLRKEAENGKEFRSPGERNPPVGGRPEKPDSSRNMARAMGVSLGNYSETIQHGEVLNKYPALGSLPKKEAIRTAKQLDALPPEEKPKVIETIKAARQPEAHPPEKTPEEIEAFKKAQRFKVAADRLIDKLFALSKRPANYYFRGLDDTETAFSSISVFAENRLEMIDRAVEWLKDFRTEYNKRIVNKNQPIRRVK